MSIDNIILKYGRCAGFQGNLRNFLGVHSQQERQHSRPRSQLSALRRYERTARPSIFDQVSNILKDF